MSGRGKFFVILVFIIMFILGFYFTVSYSVKRTLRGGNVAENSILEIPLTGTLSDRSGTQDNLWSDFSGPSLYGIEKSLKMAAVDKRINGVVLVPYVLSDAGFGKIRELGELINRFRQSSGKKVYAYIETCSTKEYYLATFCDSVFVVPTGMVIVNGLSGNMYYIRKGLEKLGISADFIAIGKYKNAPEMFTRSTVSEDQAEVMNALLDQYYDEIVNTIAVNRKLSVEQVKNIMDTGFFSSRQAVNLGLADGERYKKDIYEALGAVNGKSRRVAYVNYVKQKISDFYPVYDNKIAVIYAQGNINLGTGDLEKSIPAASFVNMIRKLKNNKKIKAVVLRINSPGGSGVASEIIYNALRELKKEKPLIVSVADMAASGGYYMAMAGDVILAQPGSIVGSIGVFAGKFSMGGLYKKLGVNKVTFQRGKNAAMFNESTKFSYSERKALTELLEEFYNEFVRKVAFERNRSWEQIHKVAQGRVWSAKKGIELGLVDRIGTLADAVDIAADSVYTRYGIKREKLSVAYYPAIRPFIEKFVSRLQASEQISLNGLAETEELKPLRYFYHFTEFGSYEPLAILPYYLEIN